MISTPLSMMTTWVSLLICFQNKLFFGKKTHLYLFDLGTSHYPHVFPLNPLFKGNFEDLVGKFQMALYHHCNSGSHSFLCWYSRLMNNNTYFKTSTKNRWHYDAELLRSQKTSHIQKQAGMFLYMHGLSRSPKTARRVLGSTLEQEQINDMFKKQ